jgi:membrane protease YdiL (CAAX protease family)
MRAPFSLQLALAWTVLATAALWLGLGGLLFAFPRVESSIVLLGLVQVLVYGAVIALFALAQSTRVADVLAVRRAPVLLCLIAAALGFSLQVPATLLSNAVERLFPTPAALLLERAQRITPHSTAEALSIFLTVAVLGPCVEEFFFRGALFGALRRGHGALVTGATVAACFALGHLDLRLFLPLFVAALALGEVRECSGSIWPGIALHGAFNGTTLAAIFWGVAPNGTPPPLSLGSATLGLVTTAVLLQLTRRFALGNRTAQTARQRDHASRD